MLVVVLGVFLLCAWILAAFGCTYLNKESDGRKISRMFVEIIKEEQKEVHVSEPSPMH